MKKFFSVFCIGSFLAIAAPASAHESQKAHTHPHAGGQLDQLAKTLPTEPGQDAFGTLQEIVSILEDSPSTPWHAVDLEALRQHLIDMNALTLQAHVHTQEVEGGFLATITGTGRTIQAIQAMVPTHAQFVDGHDGWSIKVKLLENGAQMHATADNFHGMMRLRGLGFIGVMASQAHHQEHHLAMALGQPMHGPHTQADAQSHQHHGGHSSSHNH